MCQVGQATPPALGLLGDRHHLCNPTEGTMGEEWLPKGMGWQRGDGLKKARFVKDINQPKNRKLW